MVNELLMGHKASLYVYVWARAVLALCYLFTFSQLTHQWFQVPIFSLEQREGDPLTFSAAVEWPISSEQYCLPIADAASIAGEEAAADGAGGPSES